MLLSQSHIDQFMEYLELEEKTDATIEKYIRDARCFVLYLAGKILTKDAVVAYKQTLIEKGYAARSINSMIASVNSFLCFLGCEQFRAKQLRVQREVFCPEEKELTRDEYFQLLYASKSKPQINLILQTICATGIRVSELRYFTVENLRSGSITVYCKSKRRIIFVPQKLREKLRKYAAEKKIKSGYIFVSRKGTPLDRSYIWAQMKKLCHKVNINPAKVFPHNLRKLFARSFYQMEKDIAKLADILGHSNIETTRIYIKTSGQEYGRKIEQLKLLI